MLASVPRSRSAAELYASLTKRRAPWRARWREPFRREWSVAPARARCCAIPPVRVFPAPIDDRRADPRIFPGPATGAHCRGNYWPSIRQDVDVRCSSGSVACVPPRPTSRRWPGCRAAPPHLLDLGASAKASAFQSQLGGQPGRAVACNEDVRRSIHHRPCHADS